ncbi:MAG: sigma factor-like helix-turn-helix DNA-binding protein [Christensenellales bacterium]
MVVCLRYGLCGARVHATEIAEKMKISRSYVSRIEKKAVGKITKAIGVNGR